VVTDEADNQGVPTVAFVNDVSDNGSCPEIITRTYSVTDACNNQILVTQIITVMDITAPTASNPAPITVDCIGDVPVPNIAVVTDEADNCTAAPVVAFVGDVSDGNNCNGEVITRTYSVTDACGNTVNVTQTITIDAVTPIFTLSSTNPTTCGGAEGTITISGLNPSENYAISYGGIDISSTPFDGSGNIVITGLSQGSYTTFVVADANCSSCNTTDNTVINLTDPALPNVSAGPDQSVCDGSSVTLAGSGATSYEWTNSVIDGVAFTAAAGTVVYTVTGTDANLCSNSDQVSVTSNLIPLSPNGNPVTYCVGEQASPLQAFPVLSGVGGEVYEMTWYGIDASGGVGSPLADIPSTATVGSQWYYVSQVDVATGCEGPRLAILVTINALTVPQFTQVSPMCEGVTPPQLPVSTPTITGTWSPATINTLAPGTATYVFTPSPNQCAATQTMDVMINPSPVMVITPPANVCYPNRVDLTNPAVTAGSVGNALLTYWTSVSPMTAMASPSTVDQTGTYYIQSTSVDGCTTTSSVYVGVHALPVASFAPSPVVVSNYFPESTMMNSSVNAVSYLWDFGDGEQSQLTSPLHEFPNDVYGNFTITLIAESQDGCLDTAFAVVTVKEELIYYVPNSFTPNGTGPNEQFLPVFTSGYDPYDYSLLIFNRWGQIVFESHDAKQGWKGTMGADGDVAQDGTYTWKIEFKLKADSQRKMVVGHVNLFR
jgi:gliding motility-associated-like protein